MPRGLALKAWDAECMFWDAGDMSGAPWTTTGAKNSSSVDLAGVDMNEANPPEIQLSIKDPTNATGTITWKLQDSADDATFADVDPSLMSSASGIGAADASLEFIRQALPQTGLRRYVRLVITIATAGYTAGTINAGLV